MNLSLKIARRYLFAKKSTNAINIISGISVLGIAIGTAALVLVLSVFNGFEDLLSGLFGTFNPDLKVTPIKGKTFETDSVMLQKLRQTPGIAFVSETLEEVAFFEYKDRQDFGVLKGVDEDFTKVTDVHSTMREGALKFREDDIEMAVLGGGLRMKLSVDVEDRFSAMAVYMPRKDYRAGMLEQPFRKRFIYPAGTFINQQDYDNQYVLTSLEFARELLGNRSEVSSLEIKIDSTANNHEVQQQVSEIMGPEFHVKNRYEQDEAFMKLMNIEKWMSFAILALMLILVAFNMIGALWMIVMEKQQDVAILKSMGTFDITVRNIFLAEGLLLTLSGISLGLILSILLYLAQKTFGIIAFPGGFALDAYPISMRIGDLIIVIITVVIIGIAASILPARRAMKIPAIIREE